MTESPGSACPGIDRRKFILLAGAAAAFGGFLIASRGKGIRNLLNASPGTQARTAPGPYVKSPAPSASGGSLTTLLSRLLGGKL